MINAIELLLMHPFWQKILTIQPENSPPYFELIAKADTTLKIQFLSAIVKGFYPLTFSSAHVFKRVEQVTADKAKYIARAIYTTELGLKPLIKTISFEGVTHPEQFRMLIESLQEDCIIAPPLSLTEQFIDKIAVDQQSLSQILGYASVIEHNGPNIIYALQDFISQWQTHTRRKSSLIKFQFVYEHGLVEGQEGEEQHIAMVNKMAGQYSNKIDNSQFNLAIQHFVMSYHSILDKVYEEIQQLLKSLADEATANINIAKVA
jgi:hypothetical protein